MSQSLIIVESPTKAKTITRFLGKGYKVLASFGHVRDLPKSKLSIDVEGDFEPVYTIPIKAKEVIKELKTLAKDAKEIILATDEDREGEAISWHLLQALGINTEKDISKGKYDNRVKRITFHEITQTAIEHALKHPRQLDLNLVNAQQARRVLDRLVGYELSPFLWHKIRYGLSAGRVQSVAVRLIVEREREIEKFVPVDFWTIHAELSKKKDKKYFQARLHNIDGKTLEKLAINSAGMAEKIVAETDKVPLTVQNVEKKEVRRNPNAPFTTSTLQQTAARKFGMSAKQIMVIAQQLYEGVSIGKEGQVGLITYMRTDSVNLAESALVQIKEVVTSQYGKEFTLSEPKKYTSRAKGAQEAHEAIRPTDLSRLPSSLEAFLDKGQMKIYELIWKRTIASQMQPAVFDQTTIETVAHGKDDHHMYGFRSSGQVIKFEGFLRAYTEEKDEDDKEEDSSQVLPEVEVGEKLDNHGVILEAHRTEPPPRFTDASLIKELETNGIGRPSTYAPTLSTIQEREYVTKEEKRYKPTEVGVLVTDLLVEHFPEIIDIDFTSKIENELDEIAEGTAQWVPVVRNFYTPFKAHLIEKEKSVEKQQSVSTTACPHCGEFMIIKFGRMGKFLACPDPESKVTQPMPEEAAKIKELEEKTKDEKCPICDSKMNVKRGRFGFFLGCSRYPECKGISKIWNKTGFKCPLCAETPERQAKPGDIVEKKSRGRGKPFYACTRYPDCTLIFNKKPETELEVLELFKAWKEAPLKKAEEMKKGGAKKKAVVKKKAVKKAVRKKVAKALVETE